LLESRKRVFAVFVFLFDINSNIKNTAFCFLFMDCVTKKSFWCFVWKGVILESGELDSLRSKSRRILVDGIRERVLFIVLFSILLLENV
jgi:hypothetical protein